MMKKWEMTVQDTGKQISFERNETRESVFQIYMDHDVALAHGIQGENYFRALHEHIDEVFAIAKYYAGHIFEHHVDIYRSIGLKVDIHHECEINGHKVFWAMVYKDG